MDARLLGALRRNPYLLGGEFTGADLMIASIGLWMRSALPDDPIMEDYLQCCYARPAYKRATAKDSQ
jgi:glutathione S-transferase